MKNKLIILQGPPASGKSTWAKKYQEEHKLECVIVSRDNERNARGVYWVPEQEECITKIEQSNARIWLNAGYTVICDSTNLNPKTIAKWEELAKELDVNVEYKKFIVDIEHAIQFDKNEDRTQHVGKKTIIGFYKKYFQDEYKRYFTNNRIKDLEQFNNTNAKCVIVDLDGTTALHNGREPFDWEKIPTDVLDTRLFTILTTLQKEGIHIIFLTGRPEMSGDLNIRDLTASWLRGNHFNDFTLLMRETQDFRAGDETKKDLYQKYVKGKYNVVAVFDDSNKCVEMWRKEGLLCLQPENGDY